MQIKKIISLLFLIYVTYLDANGLISLLKNIENNHALHMHYAQKHFICEPYGVETVSQLVQRTDVNSTCMQHLYNFRKENPKEKFFAQEILHIQQQYNVEGIEGKCLLSLSSNKSYSESLIENGYGRIPLLLKYENPLLSYRFKRALKRAKLSKSGIWSDVNIRNCFLTEKKR